MNINGVARGYMSKSMERGKFFKTVAAMIGRELDDWQGDYVVEVEKETIYELKVKTAEHEFCVKVPKNELDTLQNTGPYSLDMMVWRELMDQGLVVERGHGNYIPYVLGEYKVENGKLKFRENKIE